jgi:hypothetical protein
MLRRKLVGRFGWRKGGQSRHDKQARTSSFVPQRIEQRKFAIAALRRRAPS